MAEFSRFDFEQQIMQCWGVVDDIYLLYENVLDRPTPLTTDELANALLGLHQMYQLKFEKLFDQFESSHAPLHSKQMAMHTAPQQSEDQSSL